MNNGNPAVCLFLDMSKAFDFGNHWKLLYKIDFTVSEKKHMNGYLVIKLSKKQETVYRQI